MTKSNHWMKSQRSYQGLYLIATEKINRMTHFPFEVYPWKTMPDARAVSFTSALADEPFQEIVCTDYKALRNVRYIKGTFGEAVSIADFPYRFLERELFAIDTSDEAQVLSFVRKWGVPYCPFYNSKQLFLCEKGNAPAFSGRKQKGSLRAKLLPASKRPIEDLANRILDGWKDIEEWRARFDYLTEGDGFSRYFQNAVRESEGIRRELFALDNIEDGEHAISFSEVSLTLEFLKEICAIVLALDISQGDMAQAEQIVLNLGVVPFHLFEALYRSETPESILTKPSDERNAFTDQFIAALLSGSLADIRGFLNAYLFDNGSVRYAKLRLFPESGSRQGADGIGGIGEAMLVQLIGICALETPWKYCATCGKPYKRHEKYGDTEGSFKQTKESDFCTANCQGTKRRHDKHLADKFARASMADNAANLFQTTDKRRVANILKDICETANEKYPSKRKDSPTIAQEDIARIYEEERSKLTSGAARQSPRQPSRR